MTYAEQVREAYATGRIDERILADHLETAIRLDDGEHVTLTDLDQPPTYLRDAHGRYLLDAQHLATLAAAKRATCKHEDGWIDITELGNPLTRSLCPTCGSQRLT